MSEDVRAEIDHWITRAKERTARGACMHCGTRMAAKQQVGPCIYVEPCGCRLGQGRLTDAHGKRVQRVVVGEQQAGCTMPGKEGIR